MIEDWPSMIKPIAMALGVVTFVGEYSTDTSQDPESMPKRGALCAAPA